MISIYQLFRYPFSIHGTGQRLSNHVSLEGLCMVLVLWRKLLYSHFWDNIHSCSAGVIARDEFGAVWPNSVSGRGNISTTPVGLPQNAICAEFVEYGRRTRNNTPTGTTLTASSSLKQQQLKPHIAVKVSLPHFNFFLSKCKSMIITLLLYSFHYTIFLW